MSDAAEDLEDMIERGRDQPADPGFHAQRVLKEDIKAIDTALDIIGRVRIKPIDARKPFRRKPKKDRTATWVARLNRLARELDEAAAVLHPSAWPEQLKAKMDEYRKMARRAP